MPYIFGKLWHLAIIWAIRKVFQCILQGVRFLLANHTVLSGTSATVSYIYPQMVGRTTKWFHIRQCLSLYWIYSANNSAILSCYFSCGTVYVTLRQKISRLYLSHQHFPGAHFAGAQFATPRFSMGPNLPGPNLPQKITRGPICLEPIPPAKPSSHKFLVFIRPLSQKTPGVEFDQGYLSFFFL